MKFGLIGKSLVHSYSKIIHEMFGEYSYDLVSLSESELSEFVKNNEYKGFNVTIPYKKTIMQYCREISKEAEKIGSVNTVIRREDGHLYGFNTDYAGFKALAKKNGIDFAGKKVALLGSGGTYNTARAATEDGGAREIISVSRNGEFNYNNVEAWWDCEVIVNTTPVGMYPNNGGKLINISDFKKCEGVIDVVYNPLKTRLVLEAEENGIKAAGGLYMLVYQAKEAFEIFTGKKISEKKTDEVYEKILKDTQNIVFVGMPGSGKTTAGEFLAKTTGRELIDTDVAVEQRENMSIPEIFEKYGEEYFRKAESESAADAGKIGGKIISCGGGIVKNIENYYSLAQNGKICLIKRDIESLARDNRPLSADLEAVKKLAEERKVLYEKFADLTIENNGDTEELYQKILKI